ncbi:MAG TPA: SRPBCC domain-containing protein [Rhodothermales bacterium]|nr:SRPBCC domain-containing protein [Rhodothermales bacterium]
MSRSIKHSIELETPPEETFRLLHTPSEIRHWWGASQAIVIAQTNGIWVGTWGGSEDHPDYVSAARISDFSPPHRMLLTDFLYESSAPLPFDSSDLTTEFLVQATDRGSRLWVTQHGFPDEEVADEFFAACQRGWVDTFEGIRRFVAESRA